MNHLETKLVLARARATSRAPLVATSLLLLVVVACQREDRSVAEKLDQVLDRLNSIEQKIAAGPPAGAAQRPPPRQDTRRPDPNAVYSIPIEGSTYMGGKSAPVAVVEAFAFTCPHCKNATPLLEQLLHDYGDDELKVVFKHFPIHPQRGTLPAHASCAAHRQGKFKEMYDAIVGSSDYSAEGMEKLARDLGLDMKRYAADMAGECPRVVQKDQADMAKIGVRGTPTFFVNGRLVQQRDVAAFKAIIDDELKKARQRIEQGEATAANHYQKFVVERGKKSL